MAKQTTKQAAPKASGRTPKNAAAPKATKAAASKPAAKGKSGKAR